MAKKVRVRILPLRGIGGIGKAGDEVELTKAEADQWLADGYVELVSGEPEVVHSSVPGSGAEDVAGEKEEPESGADSTKQDGEGDGEPGAGEEPKTGDGYIIEPESRRK